MDTVIPILAVLLLVFLNGFFVATEFALVSVRRTRVEQLVEEGVAGARTVRQALDHLDAYIAATQLGVTMASLGLGSVGEPVIAERLEPLVAELPGLPPDWHGAITTTFAVAVSFVIITSLHIVLGELVPKSLALQRSERIALLSARPLSWFLAAFRPFIMALRWAGNRVVRLFGIHPASGHHSVYTVDELRLVVSASERAGEVTEVSADLVEAAFNFPDLTAGQVMVPRTSVVAAPADASLGQIIELAVRTSHGRIPVYVESLDNIVGVVYLKSVMGVLAGLLRAPDLHQSLSRVTARDAMREALVVPETLPIDRLMVEMRASRIHTAIVIDEYGGTAGLVTLEDLLERVVGDLSDEFEPPEPAVIEGPDGDMVDGLFLVADFARRYELDLDGLEIEQDTLGGYVFSRLGRKPQVGDEVQLGPYTLRVERMQGLRVATVRVVRRAEATSDANVD